ncbi:MAG: UGSC family (seleno)protein [Steroidobacteraceae bacterium]
MAKIEIVSPAPAAEPAPSDRRPAERRAPGAGLRLTLIDNGKPRARELLQMIARELEAFSGPARVRVLSKSSASRVIDDAEVADIAATSDAVIAGLGDCGACSACSLADAVRMESAGVPATVLISDVFSAHVASFAATLGMPGYHSAVVPHPVSSKDAAQLARYAAAVAPRVAEQLGLRRCAC